ncbi:MAG TPA: substrate-binding domain-containing protein, partial [bacterium]|nr:substrate-binding domain-containing protein [bacterium]
LAAPQMEEDRALSHVLDRSLPIVSIHHIAGGPISTVGPDDELAGYLAGRHLVELGHRVVGSVTGIRGRRLTQSRQRGFRRALDEAGIESADELVDEGGDKVAGGTEAAARLLEGRPHVTAIFCQHDLGALGVMGALRDAGRRVPEQCSLVSCDDLDMAAHTTPPLTTVHVPFYETGAEAMRLLLRMVADPTVKPGRVLLPVHLVTRGSTAPAA